MGRRPARRLHYVRRAPSPRASAVDLLRQWRISCSEGRLRFEWDPRKDRANRLKHGLSFDEASRLFCGDRDFLEIYDAANSVEEDRFIAIGPVGDRVIVVVFLETDNVIRLISARRATARERRYLEAHRRGCDGR